VTVRIPSEIHAFASDEEDEATQIPNAFFAAGKLDRRRLGVRGKRVDSVSA